MANAQQSPAVRTELSAETGGPGDIVRLEVICSCEAMEARATVFGRPVRLTRISDHWQGLIGIDLDVTPGTYSLEVAVTPMELQPSPRCSS